MKMTFIPAVEDYDWKSFGIYQNSIGKLYLLINRQRSVGEKVCINYEVN